MSVLTIIRRQLCEILYLMREDLENKEYVNNYFICEDDCKLLPKQELQDYLITTKVENSSFLLDINKLCIQIIDIWNNDFQALKLREFEETFHSERVIFATTFFRAIHLTEEEWHSYNSIEAKKEFTENTNYKNYQISNIAGRCDIIFNWITLNYPDTGTNVIEEYNYKKYLKTGHLYFRTTLDPFYSDEFKYAKSKILNFEKSYFYIIDKLDNNKGLEFKHYALDHLREVKEVQRLSNFTDLIENVILRIESDVNNKIKIGELQNSPDNQDNLLKPIFASNVINDVLNILKGQFSNDEHLSLKELLEDNTIPKSKLYFMNNGNKLLDAFKKLIESNSITNCNKAELEQWICNNFQFRNQIKKSRQDFKLKTVNDAISNKTAKAPCKNPLFLIKNGVIIKS